MTNQREEYDIIVEALHLGYEIDGLLGQGAYGSVYKANCKTDTKTYAIKIMPYGNEAIQKYHKRELDLLRRMELINNPYFNRCFKSWIQFISDGTKRLCLLMELCLSDLGTFVSRNKSGIKFIQDQAFHQHIFHQIVNGLDYIHSRNWAHRDIHPGNVLIALPNPQQITDIQVKISDFGLARKMDFDIRFETLNTGEIVVVPENEKLTPFPVESAYAAPELVSGKYDPKVDMYSAGVVLYFISCFPLKSDGSKLKAEINEIRRGRLDIKKCLYHKNDERLSSLISNLIQADPQARFSAQEAMNFMFPRESNDSTDGDEPMNISPANDSSQASKIMFIARKEKEGHGHLCEVKELTLSAIKAEVERNTDVKACQQVLYINHKMKNEDRYMLIIIKNDEDVKKNFKNEADKHYDVELVVGKKDNQENSSETTSSGDTTGKTK